MSKRKLPLDWDNEEWRDIAGYPYEVSSCGRVRRKLDQTYFKTKYGKCLKPVPDTDGYFVVSLLSSGKVRLHKIHALVCTAWHGPRPSPKHVVRHLHGYNTHNTPDNVQWGTHKQNAEDRNRHGTYLRGDKSPLTIYSAAQVLALRTEHAALSPNRKWFELKAQELGTSVGYIQNLCKLKNYRTEG